MELPFFLYLLTLIKPLKLIFYEDLTKKEGGWCRCSRAADDNYFFRHYNLGKK